jgi:Zn-dependent peptidase ImmA (M78 family)
MAPKNPSAGLVTSFELAGFEWRVKYSNDISEYGLCNPATQEITIKAGMSKQMTDQTLCHELVHAIMFTMGKLQHDEEFTDAFGALLHQYEKTRQ